MIPRVTVENTLDVQFKQSFALFQVCHIVGEFILSVDKKTPRR